MWDRGYREEGRLTPTMAIFSRCFAMVCWESLVMWSGCQLIVDGLWLRIFRVPLQGLKRSLTTAVVCVHGEALSRRMNAIEANAQPLPGIGV